MGTSVISVSLTIAWLLLCLPVAAANPWIVTDDVVITEPIEVADVIVADGGSLTVRNVPEPGFQVTGNLFVVGNSSIRLESSVIQFMSTYHGQYAILGVDQSTIEVIDCDYRVPNQVQHALITYGDGEMVVEGTDFGDVQLISGGDASLRAKRLTGNFEVLVQDDSAMELSDIPRTAGGGKIWVWVEFPSGSVAEYTPPMPGFVSHWTFPPPGSVGIDQNVVVDRCEALLWPMLVRENSRLTLRDISEDNWVVVGLYLPESVTIDELVNDRTYPSTTLNFNQEINLVNASIDTWNLYPQLDARVEVRDSLIGEILSFGQSRVRVEGTTVDGSGGFLGARDDSQIVLWNSTVTSTIEATHSSTIELHHSVADPYPQDLTGAFTRFGAYDRGRLLADQTAVNTTPALGGDGVIGISYVVPPESPPSGSFVLYGSVGLFSLSGAPALESWRLEAVPRRAGHPVPIARGASNIEEDEIAIWSDADPGLDQMLRTVLTDSWGRTLTGFVKIRGNGPQTESVRGWRTPAGARKDSVASAGLFLAR